MHFLQFSMRIVKGKKIVLSIILSILYSTVCAIMPVYAFDQNNSSMNELSPDVSHEIYIQNQIIGLAGGITLTVGIIAMLVAVMVLSKKVSKAKRKK